MNLNEYFNLPDTPMRNSPVGKLMVRILEEFPDLDLEFARTASRIALNGTGGGNRIDEALQKLRRRL
jgi:hypothetical protein